MTHQKLKRKVLLRGNGYGVLLEAFYRNITNKQLQVLLYSYDIYPYKVSLTVTTNDYIDTSEQSMMPNRFTDIRYLTVTKHTILLRDITAKILPKVK